MLNLRVWLCDAAGNQKRVLEALQPEVGDQTSMGVVSFHLAEAIPTPFLVQVEYTVGEKFVPLTRNDVFKIDEDSWDDADESGIHQYAGAVYPIGALSEHWVVANERTKDGQREFVGAGGEALSAGAILIEELTESKGAGWAPAVTLGFTASQDADGVAWTAADKQAFSLRVPSSQSELLRALVEQSMCDVESRGMTLRALRPGTTRDRTNVVLGGPGFSRVPVKTSTQDRFTRLHVKFDGGGFWIPVPDADESFGTIDALLTLQGVSDHASAMRAAQAHLEEAKTRRQESYEWTPDVDGWVPWRDFQVGDTVTGLAGGGRLPRRVLSMKVRQPESGGATVQVTIGETILSAEVRRAKLLGSVTVGTIISGSGSSFPSSPPPVDAKPKAPLGVVVSSNVGRWADDHAAVSDVTLGWAPVTEAEDGSAVTVVGYEVWSRLPSGELAFDTASEAAPVLVSSWESGRSRAVAVRAQSSRGVWGPFSTEIMVTPAVPASIVPKPVTGLVTSSNTATFLPDGRAVATIVFGWAAVTQSTDDTPVDIAEYEFSAGAETQRVTGLSGSVQVPSLKGVTVKVRALSTLGVWGDYSAPLTVTGATPAVVLPAPVLTLVGGMGGVLAAWDGLLGGAAPAAGFSRVVLEIGTSATGPWTVQGAPWVAAGSQSVQAPVGEGRWARARAFDTLGRAGAYSAVVTATAAGVPLDAIPGLEGDLDAIQFTSDGKNRIYLSAGTPVADDPNYFANPSFEDGAALVGARRNWNPSPRSFSVRGSVVKTDSVMWNGVSWTQFDVSANGHGARQLVPLVSLVSGDAYTYIVEAGNPTGSPITVNINWCNVGGGGQLFTLAPGERRVIRATGARAYDEIYRFGDVGALAGQSFLVRLGTVEKGLSSGEPFDGTDGASSIGAADPDMTPGWLAGVNTSVSVLRGTNPIGTVTPSSVAVGLHSSRWVKHGDKSLRQIPTYGTRGSGYTELASHANPSGMLPGRTYTILATHYQEQVQGISSGSAARAVTLTGTTGNAHNVHVSAPDTVGEHDLRLKFTIPPTGPWYLRLYNGGMLGDPDSWWDCVGIYSGDYQGRWKQDFQQGDLWFKLDAAGVAVESIRVWSGAAWAPQVLYADSIIATGSITGVLIEAGTLSVDHVVPNFGQNLNLSANGTINLITGAAAVTQQQVTQQQATLDAQAAALAAAQAAADTANQGASSAAIAAAAAEALAKVNQAGLDRLGLVVSITEADVQIRRPGSLTALHLAAESLSFRQNGTPTMWLDSGRIIVPKAQITQMEIGNFLLEKSGDGLLLTTL